MLPGATARYHSRSDDPVLFRIRPSWESWRTIAHRSVVFELRFTLESQTTFIALRMCSRNHHFVTAP